MRIAREVATWSKDPSTQVGAIIVKERRIIATGYNGFPKGIADDQRLYVREQKYPLVIHAEMNALLNALAAGVSPVGASLYCYGLPVCSNCMKSVIQSGVADVIVMDPTEAADHWLGLWINESLPMLMEAGLTFHYVTAEELDRGEITH